MDKASAVTPKDFFLWLGIIIGLYGSVIAFLTLVFDYINRSFPDALAGAADPYAASVHVSMATLLVFVPATTVLVYLVRNSIKRQPEKEFIWVRRWAIVLTLFITGLVVAIDLITLFTTFLGGEITVRFLLKVLVVLLVGVGIFLHFLAERWGYWFRHPKKAHTVAIAAIAVNILVIAAGFVIVGTPGEMRMQRFDAQKVSDLDSIQWQLVSHFQQSENLPEALEELNDSISGYSVPLDPQSNTPYTYRKTGKNTFDLCATFNNESKDLQGRGEYPSRDVAYPMGMGIEGNWEHGTGEVCFSRTIDPVKFPPFSKPI